MSLIICTFSRLLEKGLTQTRSARCSFTEATGGTRSGDPISTCSLASEAGVNQVPRVRIGASSPVEATERRVTAKS